MREKKPSHNVDESRFIVRDSSREISIKDIDMQEIIDRLNSMIVEIPKIVKKKP